MAHWQLNELAVLHWRQWQDEWVIFDESSGQTLVADALMAASLMALEEGALSLTELEAQVRDDLQWPASEMLAPRIVTGLEFLSGLGLVRAENP
ncbi:hypothetical protein [Pseudorhodoferax sp. Leaf265]|jgi:hypothetical protein|uniref:hypothetical protein n=1 Tax=Pseudorhodoferax sp. Leaf265 TaxID=1736315 RepID=UPI00070000F6|nr:hypothetical protein [Pseudorhodoferax sp. Leaf265]KQP20934.1 hypothetical protein ASF45_01670 [Pseudorhodoferax sp. Leaf265]